MKIVPEQILFECLEQFETGASVEELVAKYPHAEAEIEKFLAVAAHLQHLNLQPGLAAKRQSQKLFLQEAANLRAGQRRMWFSWRTLQRKLLPVASLALVAILFAATLLFASASALPGDLLYDAKRWVESYQLEQAGDATAVFSLNEQINQERMREVKAILRTNETVAVSFEGFINTKQGNNWVIAGVSVHVNEQTQVEGYAGVGAMVQVNGRTQNGHLYASSIVVLREVAPTNTPAPAATNTATATPMPTTAATNTPMPTTTITSTPAGSATPTVTSTPSKTPPTPTAVPPTATSEPTSVPTVVVNNDDADDGNDNSGDDNHNDNASGGSNDNDSNDNDSNDNGGSNSGSNDNGNDNSGDDNGNNNGGDDNGNENSGGNHNDNGNDNSGGDNGNDNDDNDNDNGGNSGSGGGGNNDNGNDNGDNSNDNGRRDDD